MKPECILKYAQNDRAFGRYVLIFKDIINKACFAFAAHILLLSHFSGQYAYFSQKYQ